MLDGAGWLTLGDLGSLDDRGYLTLVGRESEMYIRGGYNVHPAQVENVLAEHPGVARAAVVGLPDPVLGQVGAAWVVCAPGASPTADELRAVGARPPGRLQGAGPGDVRRRPAVDVDAEARQARAGETGAPGERP